MEDLKIISLNANGLILAPKRKALFFKLRKSNADFIFLQETHSTQQDQRIGLSEWGGHGIFAHGRSNSRGVSILFKHGATPSTIHTISDPEGRFLIAQIQRNEEHITLVNAYAPTQNEANNQVEFINKLHETWGNLEIHTLITAGDDKVLNSQTNTSRASYINHIQALLQDYNLADVWREKNPSSKKGTFHRGQYSALLDYLFLPCHLLPSVLSIKIVPEPLSDHCMLEIQENEITNKCGPGFWRFNKYWLSDPVFIEVRSELRSRLQVEKYLTAIELKPAPFVRWTRIYNALC